MATNKRRRRQQMASGSRKKKNPGHVVAASNDGEEVYWEVDHILDYRLHHGKGEYLIRWKNCDKGSDSWEPEENLCDSLVQDAVAKRLQKGEKQLGLEAGEGGEATVEATTTLEKIFKHQNDTMMTSTASPLSLEEAEAYHDDPASLAQLASEDATFDWTDAGQLRFRDIERLHVNDAFTKDKVADARLSGVPFCLIGHRGWVQFAKRWRKSTSESETTGGENEELLDLSQPFELDIHKMEKDIGEEPVPVLRENYDELNPLDSEISLASFLKKCWQKDDMSTHRSSGKNLYLHQWQYPLSPTASAKLCGPGTHAPLPNDIFGEDLLQYWLDEDQLNRDNPYQYIFMGREGTRSKLHQDKGGLAITIAPIIGEKEVVLVHRSDGPTSLYHLEADINNPDLHKFPLMYSARIWKTVVRPGEILVIPQGTFHQCRNIKPCLSYHRFVLDETNLKAFLESHFNEDAPEIEHRTVLWNACSELVRKVEDFCSNARKTSLLPEVIESPSDIVRAARTLRLLRNVSREIVLRKDPEASHWETMVTDIDQTLHEFRYRSFPSPPLFRVGKAGNNSKKAKGSASTISRSRGRSKEEMQPSSTMNMMSPLQFALHKAPKLGAQEGKIISDDEVLSVGDVVQFRLLERSLEGSITRVEPDMTAALLEFDGCAPYQNEFQPIERVNVQVAGELTVAVSSNQLHCGMHVYYVDKGETYRAVVAAIKHSTFYLMELHLPQIKSKVVRWVSRDSVVAKLSVNSSATSETELVLASPSEPELIPVQEADPIVTA